MISSIEQKFDLSLQKQVKFNEEAQKYLHEKTILEQKFDQVSRAYDLYQGLANQKREDCNILMLEVEKLKQQISEEKMKTNEYKLKLQNVESIGILE